MTKIFNHADVGDWTFDGRDDSPANQYPELDSFLSRIPTTKALELIRQGLKDLDADSEFLEDLLCAATELLQENTLDGLVWLWDSDDLILTTLEIARLYDH